MADINVVVIGPMSSGCRMLLRALNDSPEIHAYLDTSHGTQPLSADIPKDSIPIVITRLPWATHASREPVWAGVDGYVKYEDSLKGITNNYSCAFHVTYEELCKDINYWTKVLALFLGLKPWTVLEPLINQNEKWNNGGGPQVDFR